MTTAATKQPFSGFDFESYQPMSVVQQMRGAILRRIRAGLPLLPEIDGRDEAKSDVVRALLSGAHPYLVSEEGTGKTRLARALTNLLPSIPIIKGCLYHDDPKWPRELLCPRCKSVSEPVREFGIDFVPNTHRFSRIQGNEYTNEAKLLGLKDIQAIAHGKSPADPEAFTGTGVFRANRGVLFIDELPSIRTKIQVLLHPILEEKKAILEEYNWQHPLDLVFVATGNPSGFAHVNDIPRPLLDRLELIYMDLPDETVEKRIIVKEGFKPAANMSLADEPSPLPDIAPAEVVRNVIAPWWVIDLVNKAVRRARICPYVEKRPSIRASIKALDHTYASVEMEALEVANLRHAFLGLRLALRGRLGLRADLIDFDEARKSFVLAERLANDFLWNAAGEMRRQAPMHEINYQKLGDELARLVAAKPGLSAGRLPPALLSEYSETKRALHVLLSLEADANRLTGNRASQATEELHYSAIEFLANLCVFDKTLTETRARPLFIATEYV